jgi:hypothetical protein
LAEGKDMSAAKTVQIVLKDLQTKEEYSATITASTTQLMLGGSVQVVLDHPEVPYYLNISQIRGWLISETGAIIYLFDGDGKCFKITGRYKTVASV